MVPCGHKGVAVNHYCHGYAMGLYSFFSTNCLNHLFQSFHHPQNQSWNSCTIQSYRLNGYPFCTMENNTYLKRFVKQNVKVILHTECNANNVLTCKTHTSTFLIHTYTVYYVCYIIYAYMHICTGLKYLIPALLAWLSSVKECRSQV